MVLEVKGGEKQTIVTVRALYGVMANNAAEMVGLIIMEPLGHVQNRNFRTCMAEAGDLELLGTKYARMQMLTIADILEGKRFNTPGVTDHRLLGKRVHPSLKLGYLEKPYKADFSRDVT